LAGHALGRSSLPARVRGFQYARFSGHAVRLNFWARAEGLPVSSVNCGRPLHTDLVAPELITRAGCRITDEDTSLLGHQPDARYAALPSCVGA